MLCRAYFTVFMVNLLDVVYPQTPQKGTGDLSQTRPGECSFEELVESKRFAVKVTIIDKLKLENVPNTTTAYVPDDIRSQISRIYKDLVRETNQMRLFQQEEKRDKSKLSREKLLLPDSTLRLSPNTVLHRWNIKDGVRVDSATLRIPADVSNVKVYILSKGYNKDVKRVRKRQIEPPYNRKIDITDKYNSWMLNLGKEQEILFCSGKCYSESEDSYLFDSKPVIVVQTNVPDTTTTSSTAPVGDRSKRYAGGGRQDCTGFPNKCCYKEHIITFKELGLDYVILEPQQFNAGLCMGICEEMWQEQFYHSVMMSHSGQNQYLCCSPSKLQDLRVILYDPYSGSYSVIDIPQIMVEECGCK